MEQPKLCYIEWVDINTNCGPWVEVASDNTEPSPCYSFGWLIYEHEDYVTISATYSDHEDSEKREAIAPHAIPRGCIRTLLELDADQIKQLGLPK
jgi:hypothetical protein